MTRILAFISRCHRTPERVRARHARGRLGLHVMPLLLAFSLLVIVTHASAEDDQTGTSAAAELRRLGGIWNHWASSVKSLKVEGYQFFGNQNMGANAFLRRDLLRLVKESVIPAIEQGARDQESLSLLTAPLFTDPSLWRADAPQPPTGAWRPYRLVESAGKRRLDLKFGRSTHSRVRKDGTEQNYQSGAKQVSLYPTHSNVLMEDIAYFAYAPGLSKRTSTWSLARSEGKGRLASERSVLEYDEPSGFLEHRVDRAGENWYFTERFQAMPLETSTGVPIAQFIADATFWQGGDPDTAPVHWLHMYVLNVIEVNRTVDPSEFALAVPEGTNIVSFDSADNNRPSEGATRPPMRLANKPVPDAAAFFTAGVDGQNKTNAATTTREPVSPERAGDVARDRPWKIGRITMIGANVIALLGLFAWAKRKRRL